MEGNSCSLEHKSLIGELIQGMESAKQLKQNLSSKASSETKELLVQRILCSYEKALLILNWSGSIGPNQQQHQRPLGVVTSFSVPESPISATESPHSDDQDIFRDGSKKRKTLPRWTDQVRVSSENGLEGPQDDGFSWRKYGQKDILGAKYPRSYYRCTFRNTQGCWATKQVQRSDEDPFLFDLTYRGNHTCSQSGNNTNAVQPPNSPQNQDQKPMTNTTNTVVAPQQQQPKVGDFVPKFPPNLRVVTQDLDNRDAVVTSSFSFPSTSYTCLKVEDCFETHLGLDDEAFMGSFSQPFMSPNTPESSYYSFSPFHANNNSNNSSMLTFGPRGDVHRSESDLTEIISANTSATNSPIPDLDFSLDQVNIDPNFPFNAPGFFS